MTLEQLQLCKHDLCPCRWRTPGSVCTTAPVDASTTCMWRHPPSAALAHRCEWSTRQKILISHVGIQHPPWFHRRMRRPSASRRATFGRRRRCRTPRAWCGADTSILIALSALLLCFMFVCKRYADLMSNSTFCHNGGCSTEHCWTPSRSPRFCDIRARSSKGCDTRKVGIMRTQEGTLCGVSAVHTPRPFRDGHCRFACTLPAVQVLILRAARCKQSCDWGIEASPATL